jgi:hypothetical protein
VSGGFGTAEVGGEWKVFAGATSDVSVSGGQGVLRTPVGNAGERVVGLRSSWVRDLDIRTTVNFTAPSGTGSANGFVTARRQTDGSHVRLGLKATAGRQLQLRAQLNTGTNLFTDVDTGLSFQAGVAYELRVQLQGTSIRMKAWKSGTTEPASWTVARTSTAGPQTAGGLGVRTVNYSSSTVTVRMDNLSAAPMATATASAASARKRSATTRVVVKGGAKASLKRTRR